MNVIWPPSNFQMHHLAGNHLNAPPDCISTRSHNYRQTPRLPGYSRYLGKSRVLLHRTRISLLSWLLLQSQPFIKLQEWVLLTLGGLKVTGLNISKMIRSRQADWTSGESVTTGQFRSRLLSRIVSKCCVLAFNADVVSLLHRQRCNVVTLWPLMESRIRKNEGTQQPCTSSASWPGLLRQSSNVNGQPGKIKAKSIKTGQSYK